MAQIIIEKINTFDMVEVDQLETTERAEGGFREYRFITKTNSNGGGISPDNLFLTCG